MLSRADLEQRLAELREQEQREALNLAAVKGAIQQVELFLEDLPGDSEEAPRLEVVHEG